MKKKIILFTITSFIFICCTKKSYPETAELTFITSPSDGLVEISAIGYGSSSKDAELDTYTTAFNNILFKGIPDFGALRIPLIDNEMQSKSSHSDFYKRFFERRDYMRFVTNQGSVQALGKSDDKNMRKAQKNITINYDALRKHLEQEGVIRKFGY
jgi:hypothetical protein